MEITSMDMPIELELRLEMENDLEVLRRLSSYNVYSEKIIGKDIEWFEEELGFRPVGMWPSEEAVSPAMVEPVSSVGIEWMDTDEELLKQSRDLNGEFV